MMGYKFVKDDLASKHGSQKWKVGKWQKYKGKLVMCSSGFHASEKPLDTLRNMHTKWTKQGKLTKREEYYNTNEPRKEEIK